MLRRMWAQFSRQIGPALSPVLLAARRLKAEAWLAAAISIGLLAAVAFTTSIPTYSNAVYARLLRKELHEKTRNYPPFAFMFHFLGAKHGYAEWDDVRSVDSFLTKQAAGDLGLPRTVDVRFFQTVPFSIFPRDAETRAIAHLPTADLSFAFQSDLEQKITILEGRFPAGGGLFSSGADPVEVVININLAEKMGWQVGETFVAFSKEGAGSENPPIQIPFLVVGVWQMTDRHDEYWFYNPFALIRSQLLVSEETFSRQIGSYLKGEIAVGAWYMVLDGESFEVREAGAFLERLRRVDQGAAALLTGTSLLVAPSSSGLQRYQRAAQAMTQSLFVIALPIFGSIAAYLWLVAGVYVERRRAEISLLRSRGASASQISVMVVLEGLAMGGIAWAGGVPLGSRVAQVIDRTQGFLEFGGASTSPMTITPSVERIAIVTVALALLFILVPTLGATRHTLASYRRERARGRWKWRHALGLDLLIFLAAGYGMYRLRSEGGLVSPGTDDAEAIGPVLDPLLFITPVLWLLGFALLGVRFLTPLMLTISWLSRRLEGLGLLLAVRRLARSTGSYRIPLLLLILTLSLAVFTASLAQTMSRQIVAEIRYRFGADMRLTEVGESIEIDPLGLSSAGGAGNADSENVRQESTSAEGYTSWSFLPVAEHRNAPGVQAVARVGRYKALAEVGQWRQEGHFIGIDRTDFPQVVFWRTDFARSSLGSLMNALAMAPNGVLVPNSFLRRMVLEEGDDLRVVVSIPEQRKELTWVEAPLNFRIVGSFDRFPSWEPEHGPAIVGNLDYVFESAGGQFPFDVWLRTEPDPDYLLIERELKDKGFRILGWEAPGPRVLQALRRPEFQGVVGLLSIGFAACTLLTVLGFALFTVSSFRERAIETGVLRALGFTPQEVISLMGWELIVLLLFGLTVGTGIGIWTSGVFIPLLQSGIDPMPTLLPLAPQIAWPRVYQVYLVLGILYICSTALLTISLMRSQVTQAIKMGETI
ncbi:MAG: ABC transporter permease [Caldilineaceae bacterium]|nr:ABC transporter permease [Caldilineaceae bacterium]